MCLIIALEHRFIAAKTVAPVKPRPGQSCANRIRCPSWDRSKSCRAYAEVAVDQHRIRLVETELVKGRDSTVVDSRVPVPDALRTQAVRALRAFLCNLVLGFRPARLELVRTIHFPSLNPSAHRDLAWEFLPAEQPAVACLANSEPPRGTRQRKSDPDTRDRAGKKDPNLI